jgi:hypothetical protein
VLSLIARWGLAALRSLVFSDSLIGLVFGGFGTKDLFPSMYTIELDGIFFKQLKKKVINNVDIDRRGEHAKIVPFAQSEMAERFLFGIDAEMQGNVESYIRKSISRALDEIKKKWGIDAAEVGLTAEGYESDVSRFLERLKRRSRDETLDMVDFMPKQELAYTAEAFVNLTSIKRKVSAQQETVGGPVDVAVITRNEGFVWIRRKHYFNVEQNAGYTVRTFGNPRMETRHDRPKKTPRRNRGAAKTQS